MSGFERFSFGSAIVPKEEKPAELAEDSKFDKKYSEREFLLRPKQEIISLARKREQGFHVDSHVADHLKLEEREKHDLEQRYRVEIERRWEKAKEQAEAEGFQKGLQEGIAEAYKAELPRINERLEHLNQVIMEFDQLRERIFNVNEAFLMRLIAQVAKTIILKEISLDKEYIHRLVLSLLDQLGKVDDIKIFLSPQDFENVETLKKFIEKEFGKLKHTTIESDIDLTAGACKVETSMGVIDASIETQMANIIKTMSSS